MEDKKGLWNVSAAPHIRFGVTTRQLMLFVMAALLPAAAYGVYLFGPRAALLIVVCMGTSVGAEFLFEKLSKRDLTVTDGSAALSGLLLAMNLPVSLPIWMAVLGSVFAIVVVKQFFGGLGANIMNPALAGRCFLLLSFSKAMTDYSVGTRTAEKIVDSVSGATPLAAIKSGESFDLFALLVGNTRGTIGETSAILLLAGGIFLAVCRVINLSIPLVYIGTFIIFAAIFGGHGFDAAFLLSEVLGGGLMLGAWFMATDYVTRPITVRGRYVYGALLGILTGVFRFVGSAAEGVSFAIIFTNLCVPLIERLTMRRGFGIGRRAHKRPER